MTRSNRVEIRLNDAELAAVNGKRGAMRLRTFIRHAILESIPPVIPSINADAMSELHRIGSNLNQLARHVNSGDAADLHELRKQVSALRLSLVEVQA